jgi:dihydrolipoamide dehydrogenase
MNKLKTYDLIAIGTGSAMIILESMLRRDPDLKAAVIDKDDPGGICLTRGCIPTKLLIYPADMVRHVQEARNLGIDAKIRRIDFHWVMERMRSAVQAEVEEIRESLTHSENVDYFHGEAEFVGPYKLKVRGHIITAKLIFLCLGSRPQVPQVEGLEGVKFYTSDDILQIQSLPRAIAILGGGYIAAEYGHFFSSMGSRVTIIGRNPQFLPSEEPEVSRLALQEMSRHMDVLSNHEVIRVEPAKGGKKKISARDRATGRIMTRLFDEMLVAAGRTSNADMLHPDRSGVQTDEHGWIRVNPFLETTRKNIWAMGDATGRHLFKHVANYEAGVVYHNAVLKQPLRADYRAVPHAVFTYPEIAAVGLKEKEAIEEAGREDILIGFQRYEDTARGQAMGVKGCFVKVIVERRSRRILGAHIIGPQASVLIQEIVNLMYTQERSMDPIVSGMHIHPALTEVVERAFYNLMPVEAYHHTLNEIP